MEKVDFVTDNGFLIGVAVKFPQGWKFISNLASRNGSRKYHDTFKSCIPVWAKSCKQIPNNG